MRSIFLVLALYSVAAGADPARAEAPALHPATAAIAASRAALVDARATAAAAVEAPDRAARLLAAGLVEEARALVPALLAAGPEARVTAAEILFAVQDYEILGAHVPEWRKPPNAGDPAVRRLLYRWLVAVDDLETLERETAARLDGDGGDPVDRLAAGKLSLALLRRDEAGARYEAALDAATLAGDRAAALRGLGEVALKRLQYDEALEFLLGALALAPLDADVLTVLAENLIRLGRTDDAIAALELAVEIAPYHETAHYYLGNGYARRNYTQLFAARPDAFAGSDSTGREALRAADRMLAAGDAEGARKSYASLAGGRDFADVEARLGSLAYSSGDLPGARARFLRALAVCPEYGRAHNGLAKTLEAERLRIEVHRDRWEREFAARREPAVPGIERFVLNWNSLSPRHRKMVALAVAPWARYLPVLIEGGQTYYLKPLHELLSETPGQETLRDQRINYDSRLWDDVRGCGGFHTVTGIEDVERTIVGRYNTVLHELSHQVHGVLTADRSRAIEELYRSVKQRDDASGDAFLSRYAGGSVWEYFAEGANALESPKRDAWDTREIVRERLDEKDPPLRRLVVELMERADVESTYAVAFANRGGDCLERGKPLEAIENYHRALARAPDEEGALGALVYALLVADSTESAVRWAGRALRRQPESGDLVVRGAGALWHGGHGLEAAVRNLVQGAAQVRREDLPAVYLETSRMQWIAGRAAEAEQAARAALEFQGDDPEALWSLAAAEALAGRRDDAWKHYEEAVRLRTGVVALRVSFAWDLLRAGERERAREHVDAALLLDPDDPDALALDAWVKLDEGAAGAALVRAARALDVGPWSDLARAVKGRVERALGRDADAEATLGPLWARLDADDPPDLLYRPKWGRYEEVHTLPAVLRAMVGELD